MKKYYLAIDIGASSGRHILGSVENGILCLEEIYRFDNGIKNENGALVWDTERLLYHVKNGIKRCAEIRKIPTTLAVDTWGVDYVLLDESNKEILPAISYRDGRTAEASKEVNKIIFQTELYERTGIQKQNFNTIYQLYCDKKSGKLKNAAHFLMMPEYLSFKLTGEIRNEYTNATTTNLVNAKEKEWDGYILDRLGLPKEIFSPLSLPGTSVGRFTESVRNEVGFDCEVVLCPSHDTASAVAACPVEKDSVYISSGTWSLIGTENAEPILTQEAMRANFTNEGGIEYRFRFLKNIMGMWIFQNIRNNLEKSLSYDEMMQMAFGSDFEERIDPNAPCFVAPDNMIEAVRTYLGKPYLPLCDALSSVYHSLAESYKKAIAEIERISGKRINSVHIVGGGSKDKYLNLLTSLYTGKKVYTGLTEATATGNILSQIMADRKISLDEARKIIRTTFEIKEAENEQIQRS
ncbi:MAG: rhamnulokinase family protein [Acutalibacteraceae bacterium]|nr:rhamnulokinase [Oscillospiraceae bacterium]